MTTSQDAIWKIKPHTQAKHEILRRYLGAWFPILSTGNQHMVYIDGFCGPGRYKGGKPGSPIIALQEAIKHSDQLCRNNLTFLFVDDRPNTIGHLEQELALVSIPNNFTVRAITGKFEDELRSVLDYLDSQGSRITPTFAFIDPFGFGGLPFELLQRVLRFPKTEVFVNIMVNSINRFLEHPNDKTKQHIVDLFGTPKALEIASSNGDRIPALRLLYQEQLQKCAKFVRYFEMRDSQNKTIYYLFFATNNRLGHKKMKHAFWQVDPSGSFRFSDKTNPNQLVLLELNETPKLVKELQCRFKGQEVLVERISRFVEDETPFLRTHMGDALRLLEDRKEIYVKDIKQDGKKRIRNTFPDNVILEFP